MHATRFVWAYQVVLMVKNRPAIAGDEDMWVRSLGHKDLLEEGMATHSSMPVWRITWTENLAGYSPWGQEELDTTE